MTWYFVGWILLNSCCISRVSTFQHQGKNPAQIVISIFRSLDFQGVAASQEKLWILVGFCWLVCHDFGCGDLGRKLLESACLSANRSISIADLEVEWLENSWRVWLLEFKSNIIYTNIIIFWEFVCSTFRFYLFLNHFSWCRFGKGTSPQ